MFKKILGPMLAAILIIVLCSCSVPKEKKDSEYTASTVRIVIQRPTSGEVGPLLIMKDMHLMEKYLPEGVTVEYTELASATDRRDALTASKADIASISCTTALSAMDQSLKLHILGQIPYYPLITIYSSDDSIKSIADIAADDRIVICSSINNLVHLAFMAACKDELGDPMIYFEQTMGMSFADMEAAVRTSDDVDIVGVGFSGDINIDKQLSGVLLPILDISKYATEYSLCSFMVTTPKFASENPAFISAYNEAMQEAIDIVKNEPDKAADIIDHYWTAYSKDEIKEMLVANPPYYEISESSYDKLADFMYELGLLENAPRKFKELPNYESIPKTP